MSVSIENDGPVTITLESPAAKNSLKEEKVDGDV